MSKPALLAHPRIETPVRDLMRPGVVSVPVDASLRCVAQAMLTHRVHALLVVARGRGKPLGWVTSQSLLEHAARDPELMCAGDAIGEPPVWVSPGATAEEAIEEMLARGATHLVVSIRPDDPPEGVIAALDLVELMMRR